MGRTSDARERLIEAARELLYSDGYQGVGVEDLCRRADVRKGSFYYFFSSKQELAVAALDRFFSEGREALIEPTLGSERPPLERIRAFFEAMAEGAEEMQEQLGICGGCMFGNMAAEMASHEPALRAKVQDVFTTITGYFERTLREAVKRGDVRDINPAANARALLAYMEGLLLLGKAMGDASLMRTLASQSVAIATAPRTRAPKTRAGARVRR